MKILYAIQGTGNGHVTVAREVLPFLMKRASVDILLSGTQVDVGLPYEIRYRLHGLCFVFGKKGGIDYLETYRNGRIRSFFREIQNLPVEQYDLVISDFEPVSAWAAYLKNIPCFGFSHQAAVVKKGAPRPKKTDLLGRAVLKYYAPVSKAFGFHFLPYSKNVFTPIIRKQLRLAQTDNEGHYTVYLPAFSDERIIKMLSLFPDIEWQVFSKHCSAAYSKGKIFITPIESEGFVQSMASAAGVLCGAGFQTPSEALFMKKKLMVIPMKGQYEQQCNAAALKQLGVTVLKNLKKKYYRKIAEWIGSNQRVTLEFPDETEYILSEMLDQYEQAVAAPREPRPALHSEARFRKLLLKNIFHKPGQ